MYVPSWTHLRVKMWTGLLLWFCLPVFAQDRYVLETKGSDLSSVLSRNQLTLVRTLGPDVFLVTGPVGIPPSQLTASVLADSKVIEFEPDAATQVPEGGPGSKKGGVDPLPPILTDTSVVNYYGSIVRNIYVNQPSAALLSQNQAHQQWGGGGGVVAIIDTGVDPFHPVLAGKLAPGYDFTRNLPGIATDWLDLTPAQLVALAQSTVAILDQSTVAILDQSTVAILDQSTVAILDGRVPHSFGHGTMVAGLVHLVAPNARIMPLKAFKADGSANLSDIVRAIYYAVDNGANVINMSFSMTAPSAELLKAIAYANSKKVICVAAAGNEGQQLKVYPAGFPEVMGVGATNRSDRRSSFTNYGESSVHTSAPGEALITLFPGNRYSAVWGTSFSSALVSGAVAWMKSMKPHVKYGDIADALDSGQKIDQGMGDARLELMKVMTYFCYPH